MGILDAILNKIKEPIFVKDFDFNENLQLKQLTDLLDKVGDDQVEIIEKEIGLIKIGLSGEQNVHYELKNSRIPMLCLHDIRLEHNGHSAQFDFILICREFILVLETKKLIGDISIDNEGNFVRFFKDYKGVIYKKEGMYSPITQNQRHINLLEEFLKDHKLIRKVPVLSLVVVANDKTIVDKKYATAEIKKLIIKYDQLVNFITKLREENSSMSMSDKQMNDIAEMILENNLPIEYDFIKRLKLKIIETPTIETEVEKDEVKSSGEETDKSTSSDVLYERLRQYRMTIAKERNIDKLYFVFNNQQLSDLVLNRPTTKEQFINLSGFGEKKYQEYGEAIIQIIKEYIDEVKIQDTTPISLEETPIYKELKEYRYKKSIEDKIKPYLIYNNKQLESIITLAPKNRSELHSIEGLNETKIEQYGDDIVSIVKKYC